MKAVVLKGFGGVDQLEVTDWPDPVAGPGQILVQVAASSVNPVDWKIREGRYHRPELPVVLGRDAAGTVLEVGQGVTAFRPGDRVLGFLPHANAEKVAAGVEHFARVPEGLDLADAAALPLVVLTGAQLIEEAVRPARGMRVLVIGAAGSAGRVAVYAARQLGAHVIAGVRSRQKDEAGRLGANEDVALDDEKAVATLAQVDAIADTVGGPTTAALLPKLRKGGTLGSIVGAPAEAQGREMVVRTMTTHPHPKRLGELAEAVAQGKLRVPVGRRLPLSQVREAHQLAEKGGIGKVVLLMG